MPPACAPASAASADRAGVDGAAAPPLLQDRSFVLFLAARTVAAAGYAVTAVALPVLVLELTGSALLTALVVALEVVPYLCFGLLAGAVADRVDRRRLVLLCQLVSATALASVPLADAVADLHVLHVLVVAGVLATSFVWFDAATFGVLPALVGRDRLVRANSHVWAAATLADLVVPAGAGVLVAAVGAAAALGVDAAAYVVAAALLAAVSGSFQPAVAGGPGGGAGAGNAPRTRDDLRDDIREGVRFVWTHPVVRPLTLLGAGNSLTSGGVLALLLVYATRQLGLGEGDPRLGLVWTAPAAGAVLGALLLPLLARRIPTGWITVGTLTATPFLVVGLALVDSLVAGLLLLTAWTTASTVTILNGISTRQLFTPDHLQSRVGTTARMVAWGGTPVGALVSGLLAEVASVRVALLVLPVFVGTAAVAAWRSSLRRRDLMDLVPALGGAT